MRGSFRGVASAGVLAACCSLLLVGCSSAATTPPGPSAQSCYAFGVRALERHVTVTAVPAACAGLSPATVNLAVSRAVREVAGPRPKAAERRLAEREGARLAYLIRTVPPARPGRPAAPPAGPGSQVPLSVAALVAWLVTAAAGSYLLAGWLRHGGWRRLLMPGRDRARARAGRARARGRTGGMPPADHPGPLRAGGDGAGAVDRVHGQRRARAGLDGGQPPAADRGAGHGHAGDGAS